MNSLPKMMEGLDEDIPVLKFGDASGN